MTNIKNGDRASVSCVASPASRDKLVSTCLPAFIPDVLGNVCLA